MRKSFAVLVVSLALAACGGDDGTVLTADLSGAPAADLAVHSTADMAATVDMAITKFGCHGLAACVADCFNNATTDQEYIDCVTMTCKPAVKSNAAFNKLNAAFQCGSNYCENKVDGGVTRCADDQDTSSDCIACQNNSAEALLGLGCQPVDDPACNTPVCTASVNACLNDLP